MSGLGLVWEDFNYTRFGIKLMNLVATYSNSINGAEMSSSKRSWKFPISTTTCFLLCFMPYCIDPLSNFTTTFGVLKHSPWTAVWWNLHHRRSVLIEILPQHDGQTDSVDHTNYHTENAVTWWQWLVIDFFDEWRIFILNVFTRATLC